MYGALLVDDERAVAENIRKLVSWDKYGIERISICDNGLQAMELVEREKPDVVITDIKMPCMDGIELIRRVRQAGHEAEFIILSGYDEFELARNAMGQGVKHYLLKPCSEDEISSSLVKAISDLESRKALGGITRDKQALQSLLPEQAYEEEEMKRAVALLAEAAERRERTALLRSLEHMADTRGRGFVIFAASQLLLKRLHRGTLSTSELTRLFNGIYETKGNAELVSRIADSLEELGGGQRTEESFVDDILRYIDEHLDDERLRLKWVAKELVFRNEDYVARTFARQVGETFNAYLTNKRLERAKFLISRLGEEKIYSVAEQVGLGHNPRYFSKLFKKHTGYTPKEYKHLKG
ncbi:response regulator [Cohnella hongkongensis]|uniref:Response regulator n=1 Tax=Cohnella hongkongensis TaxID=178337 RepID=A0ABV9F9H9_9BACL